MSTFPPSATLKANYKFVNKGGSIRLGAGGKVHGVFDVLQCTIAGQENDYWVTLPTQGETVPGYSVGNKLIYNSKATNNTNADTNLTVLKVIGPLVFICKGPQRLNG